MDITGPASSPDASLDPRGVLAPDGLTDVAGLRVGHCTRVGDGWLTGTTVVLAPDAGAVAGVDVRGAAPGTRETDLLEPGTLVERVHAIVLTGGSAFGLAAADGVMLGLEDAGIGFPVQAGAATGVVPIVPAAVLFDLGRGGDLRARPGQAEGRAALAAARTDAGAGPVRQGSVGAGTGAAAGGLRGGVGTASTRLPGGATVAALIVVNAAGAVIDPTGTLLGLRHLPPAERPSATPDPAEGAAAFERSQRLPSFNTTIGVVATDLTLDVAGCRRLALVAHDGLARSIDPVHTISDGDVLFGLSTSGLPADPAQTRALHMAVAEVTARAVARAVLAAASGAAVPAYREAVPSAFC